MGIFYKTSMKPVQGFVLLLSYRYDIVSSKYRNSCTQKEVLDCKLINDDNLRLIWAIFIELHIQK